MAKLFHKNQQLYYDSTLIETYFQLKVYEDHIVFVHESLNQFFVQAEYVQLFLVQKFLCLVQPKIIY